MEACLHGTCTREEVDDLVKALDADSGLQVGGEPDLREHADMVAA
jgi:hypothetical protein